MKNLDWESVLLHIVVLHLISDSERFGKIRNVMFPEAIGLVDWQAPLDYLGEVFFQGAKDNFRSSVRSRMLEVVRQEAKSGRAFPAGFIR